MVFKHIAAVLLWLLVTLTSAFGFMASELKTASSDFFYETVDYAEQNDLGTRDTCWENGWLSYDTTSGYCVATNKGKHFDGFDFKAVRDLGHVDDSTLRAMQKHGFAAKTKNGDKIVLHHHQQNPAGPIIEVPASNHSIGNARQHPFGNQKGSGLTPEQRSAFDQTRVNYWKQRAAEELQRRGL